MTHSLTLVNGSLLKIADGSSFDHVTDVEALDSLILGNTAGAVDAANKLVMATAVLVASVVSSLAGL